jgi:hypothetical protein
MANPSNSAIIDKDGLVTERGVLFSSKFDDYAKWMQRTKFYLLG